MARHFRCIHCGSLKTRRSGKLKRKWQDPLQRFRCLGCRRTFTVGYTPGTKLSQTEKIRLTRTHLAGRTSIRQLVRDTGRAKQTIQNAIHDVVSRCVNSAWIAQTFKPSWGGYLAVDGSMVRVWDWSAKYFRYAKRERRLLHKLIWLVALDLKTLDIVHHHLGDEETMIDLVLMFQQIKANGYPLKGLVSDGNTDIPRAARLVYQQDFVHQHCQRHFLENLRAKVRQGLVSQSHYQYLYEGVKRGLSRPGLPQALFTFQTVPDLPSTNQQIENLFRQSRLRTRSISQFRSYQSAAAYLNAWTLFRRFTPFTDCRDRQKNNHAPMTLAGCDITGLNYLTLQNDTRN